MSRAISIKLQKPHTAKQQLLITHAENVVALCGRRWGKTTAFVNRIFYWLLRQPGLYWWVGLSWRSASMKRAWREAAAIARVVLRSMGLTETGYINKSEHQINIPGLGEIWFRTAENPSSLAGEGIRGVILDEFTLMPAEVWTEYIQGTLIDHNGWACFGGVPKGNNWGAALWRGAASKKGWLQLHATTYENPNIDATVVDAIRADPNTSEFFFRQEYLAEILTAEGMVFRRVNEAAVLEPLENPLSGHTYIAGVDVADRMDFTVAFVLDAKTRDVVYMDRFQRVGYDVLENRLEALYNRFRLMNMIVEDNSVGAPVIDHLKSRGMRITPFHTSPATKMPAIQALQAAFEHSTIRILNNPILVGELLSYESTRTATGIRYSAPAGQYDDCVMALAIAYFSLVDSVPWSTIDQLGRVDDFVSRWK